MPKPKKLGRTEILNDYTMMGRMSKDLIVHQRKLFAIGKRIQRRASQSDVTDGLKENLSIVLAHMNKAQKELDRARNKLKLI